MSRHPSRSASSPAGPFTALKNAAVGTANRVQDINQHAANYVVDTLRGRSTRKRSRSSQVPGRARSRTTSRRMQNTLMDIHEDEHKLLEERRELDRRTRKLFDSGRKKAQEYKLYLESILRPLQKKSHDKNNYLDRWEQRYENKKRREKEEQLAQITNDIEYYNRNIRILDERIEVSTTTETLEQNVTDTLYTRNFVTIVGAELETKAGKVITQENATFLEKFSTFRVVFTIETRYQKKHSAIVRTSDEVTDLHRVVKLYVPSVMRKIVRDIKESYAYFKTHVEVLMDEWWEKNAQGKVVAGQLASVGAFAALTKVFMATPAMLHHAAVLGAGTTVLGVMSGGIVLGIMVGCYVLKRISSAGVLYSQNTKRLKHREEHLQRKVMESTLFLNAMVFFVALAEARGHVDDIVTKRTDSEKRQRSRSSNFANRRSARANALQTVDRRKPKGLLWFSSYISKKTNKGSTHKKEPLDLDNAKIEIAKFFKQDNPERFFKPVVDVLKVDLLKAKHQELQDQDYSHTDASGSIAKLESKINELVEKSTKNINS
jgi:hypothetical protein